MLSVRLVGRGLRAAGRVAGSAPRGSTRGVWHIGSAAPLASSRSCGVAFPALGGRRHALWSSAIHHGTPPTESGAVKQEAEALAHMQAGVDAMEGRGCRSRDATTRTFKGNAT